MVSQEFDIVGIGNAIVDVITDVNDEFINQQELRKGLMSLVDLDTIKSLSNKIEIKANVSGGSVANSIVCLLYTSPSPRDATLSRMPSSA